VLAQRHQQVEFAAGQRHVAAVVITDAARGQLERELREAKARWRCRRGHRCRRRFEPPQHRLDARQQLAQVKRLGHVVVGADFEANHLVHRIAAAADDDEAAAVVLAQLARDRKAVFAGQAEIEQHQRRWIALHQRQQIGAAVRLRNAQALRAEVARDQLRDVRLVVENGDVGWVHGAIVHRPALPGRCGKTRSWRCRPLWDARSRRWRFEIELLDAVAQGVARDAQRARSAADVPMVALQGLQQRPGSNVDIKRNSWSVSRPVVEIGVFMASSPSCTCP
jgi:hypothetical protein